MTFDLLNSECKCESSKICLECNLMLKSILCYVQQEKNICTVCSGIIDNEKKEISEFISNCEKCEFFHCLHYTFLFDPHTLIDFLNSNCIKKTLQEIELNLKQN